MMVRSTKHLTMKKRKEVKLCFIFVKWRNEGRRVFLRFAFFPFLSFFLFIFFIQEEQAALKEVVFFILHCLQMVFTFFSLVLFTWVRSSFRSRRCASDSNAGSNASKGREPAMQFPVNRSSSIVWTSSKEIITMMMMMMDDEMWKWDLLMRRLTIEKKARIDMEDGGYIFIW